MVYGHNKRAGSQPINKVEYTMKITTPLLITALEQAVATAEKDIQAFGKRLTVTHEFTTEHGATLSNFSIVYTCPNTGMKFKLYDTMLWNDTDDIIKDGTESYEVAEYESIKEFHNNEREYFSKDCKWTQSTDDDVNSLLGDLATIYRNKVKVSDYLPDWKETVVAKIRETYSLEND